LALGICGADLLTWHANNVNGGMVMTKELVELAMENGEVIIIGSSLDDLGIVFVALSAR
jgi:hypothetical protein